MHVAVVFCAMLATIAADTGNTSIGYQTLRGVGSYKLHKEMISWKLAWKVCHQEGAHLAVLDDEKEANAVKRFINKHMPLKDFRDPYASIVFHSMFAESHWTTLFGVPLDQFYNKWAKYQPDNLGEIEFCGGINGKGELVDIPCAGYTYPFVCEKRSTE